LFQPTGETKAAKHKREHSPKAAKKRKLEPEKEKSKSKAKPKGEKTKKRSKRTRTSSSSSSSGADRYASSSSDEEESGTPEEDSNKYAHLSEEQRAVEIALDQKLALLNSMWAVEDRPPTLKTREQIRNHSSTR
jgi:hypothetical protein